MHRVDIADIGVAGIGALHACRVGDHFSDAGSGLFGCGGKLDVIVQTLAHLVFAVNAQHF